MVEDRENALRNMVGLFTEEDMVLLLGVSDHTLQAWRVSGNGPRFVKLGKKIYYRLVDVREWIERNLFMTTTEHAA